MLFPLYVDLSDKTILVVGGGTIATRRVRSLIGYAGKIRVVSPVVSEGMEALGKNEIEFVRRSFQAEDLEGQIDLVLAATNDPQLNARIYQLCKNKQISVNICSDQSKCDFQFPSIIEADGLVIGINGSGKDHRKVKEMRQKLETLLKADGQTDLNSKYE